MTQPLINESAAFLSDAEYERCEAIAWRLVLAQIVGEYLGNLSEFGDFNGIWNAATDAIRNGAEAEAVLETLTRTISRAMVDKDGPDSAAHDVKEIIAKADPTWLP
jgi:hypothetical protein